MFSPRDCTCAHSLIGPTYIRFLNDSVEFGQIGVRNNTAYAYGGPMSGASYRSGQYGNRT